MNMSKATAFNTARLSPVSNPAPNHFGISRLKRKYCALPQYKNPKAPNYEFAEAIDTFF
jgi:hypothetical protein